MASINDYFRHNHETGELWIPAASLWAECEECNYHIYVRDIPQEEMLEMIERKAEQK